MSGNHERPPRTKYTLILDLAILSIVIILFVITFHPFGPDSSEPFPKDEVVIAAALSMEGPLQEFGLHYKEGIEMAVADVNAAGGIRGVPLRIEYLDDKGDPNVSISLMYQIHDLGIPVAIGAIGSSNSLAMAPYADMLDIVMLSPGSTTAALTAYKDVFRTVSSDIYQGGGMVKVLENLEDADTVMVIYLDDLYGKSLEYSFMHEIEEYSNKTVISAIAINENTSFALDRVMDSMISGNPDVVVLMVYPEQGVRIMQAAEAAGLDPVWFGSDTMTSSDVPAQIGSYAEGLVGFTQAHKLTVPSFAQRYADEYNGSSLSFPVSYGYDAVVLLATCIQEGGYSYDGISHALRNIRHVGICGPRVFDENGDVQPAYDMVVLQNGTWETLKWNQILSYDYIRD